MSISIDLEKLSKRFSVSIEELKQKTWMELETMEEHMNNEEEKRLIENRINSDNYKRIVLQHYKMLPLMLRYWSLEQCLTAITKYAKESDIVEEQAIERGRSDYYEKNYLYLGYKQMHIPQYDRHGNELLERKYCWCHVYEVPNRYQSLCHGKPLRELLVTTYPELEAFRMDIYGVYGYEDVEKYEIFIKADGVSWYTPLKALLAADVDAIKERTLTYAKEYSKEYHEKYVKALEMPETKQLFETISSLKPVSAKTKEEVEQIIRTELKKYPLKNCQ